MLRIITQSVEINTELRRIRGRGERVEIRGLEATVRDILEAVRQGGEGAIREGTAQEGGSRTAPPPLRVSGSELDTAYQQISKDLLDAIQLASRKLEAFHRQRVPKSWVQFGEEGVVVARRYVPVKRAGIYVPGGTAAALRALLGQAILAKVANVPQTILATPAGADGKIHPALLVAAQEAGVSKIYRLQGPWAIAALAYGTETLPPVEVITGSGDIYTTLAKKMVCGEVATDLSTAPSDWIAIADREADPSQVAADLIAQAEQDPTAAAVLLTPDLSLAQQVQHQVDQRLQRHFQGILMEKAIAHYGSIAVVKSLEEAAELADQFGPQYLCLHVAEPWELVEHIRQAGTIFLGSATPKAVGDYLGGSLLVPPLEGNRYASTVTVETFLKPSSLIQYSPGALKDLAAALEVLAQAEGLPATVEAIRLRLQGKKGQA